MFAVICLPDFALQAVLRNEPELCSQSVALLDEAGANVSKSLVLQCTQTAGTAGVCAGFTAPQAMARCRELIVKTRSPAAEQSATDILLQTAYAFSPNFETTAPGVCTIDLRGLDFGRGKQEDEMADCGLGEGKEPQRSFEFFPVERQSPTRGGSDETVLVEWADKIIAALRQLNLTAQIGIAATPNIALLAARAARPVLVIERLAEFFATLPVAALEPSPSLLGILQRWGIRTAGAFLALGKDAVAERLGAEALELFERAATGTIRPINIVVPPDIFAEQVDFEVQIETLEPLLFVLRRFVEQLTVRIALAYRVIAELTLHLALESGAVYERVFKVPAPTASVETIFRMLHTHLENFRTDAPITSLRISAAPCRPEHQQFGLFESALRDPNHFHETLARLGALLGAERVGMPVAEATHRPDSFRMETPQFGGHQSEIRNSTSEIRRAAGLCLRRFRPALHAEVELEQGRPVFISTLMMSAPVKCARGPWCASGEWWDQRRWSRQEWDVETSRGEVYRLFNANGDWLVEGVYD